MNKRVLYLFILIVPFLGMIVINELVRHNTNEIGYSKQEVSAINSEKKFANKCTWICHNNSNFCKENHVKYVKPYFDKIDTIYFGVIDSLKFTGDYRLANILILVALFPLIIYALLIGSIELQIQIHKLRNE